MNSASWSLRLSALSLHKAARKLFRIWHIYIRKTDITPCLCADIFVVYTVDQLANRRWPPKKKDMYVWTSKLSMHIVVCTGSWVTWIRSKVIVSKVRQQALRWAASALQFVSGSSNFSRFSRLVESTWITEVLRIHRLLRAATGYRGLFCPIPGIFDSLTNSTLIPSTRSAHLTLYIVSDLPSMICNDGSSYFLSRYFHVTYRKFHRRVRCVVNYVNLWPVTPCLRDIF